MITKVELLGMYRTALNHIQLAYATLLLWSYPDSAGWFETLYGKLNNIPKPFPKITSFIRDKHSMKIACKELYESAHRTALKDLFALTRWYCHETSQLSILEAQPWFQFWRILRNCFAHKMCFSFNESERKHLPVTWSGVTIDISMNGKTLTHGQFSLEKLRELIQAAYKFLENDVS